MAPELLLHGATPVIPHSAGFQPSHHNEWEGFRAFRPASKQLKFSQFDCRSTLDRLRTGYSRETKSCHIANGTLQVVPRCTPTCRVV